MTVVLLDSEHRGQADQRAVVGEDPDDVGAPADLAVEALQRVGASDLAPVVGREGVEGQDVVLGALHQGNDLGELALQRGHRFGEPVARLVETVGVEDRADQRRQQAVLVAACVPQAVAQEVHGAALPRRAEHLGDRVLQALVGIADDQLHADQAARDEVPEEVGPERLGLRLADVQADDLPAAGLMDAVGDDHALALDPAAVSDLLDLGVEEQIDVAALQRPRPERLDLLVQAGADAADLRPAHAQPKALDELIDTPCAHAAHIGLLDNRQQRLLGALPGRQKAREVRPLADLGDLQLDLAGPGVPPPRSIAVAVRRAIRRSPLTVLGTDQLGDLDLHQLPGQPPHTLAQHVGVLVDQHLPDDLLDRHPVCSGHRRCLLVVEP
jgi:hypothetical protein